MLYHLYRIFGLCGLVLVLSSPAVTQTPKRALTHADYAAWRAIQSPVLSPDGSMVAYLITPQEGDGEFILRHVGSGKEHRRGIGSRPAINLPPPRITRAMIEKQSGPAPRFSPDGKSVLFSLWQTKAERAKTKTAAARTDLGIMDAATGKLTRIERVRNYAVPRTGPALVAYLRGNVPTDPTKGKGTTRPTKTSAPEPGDLVLRQLADGKERTFSDVTEFTLSKDGRWLLWAVNSKKGDANGVFALATASRNVPFPLRRGTGKFNRLTWDEKQTQLAFFHTPVVPQGTTAQVRIAHWKLPPATSTATSGLILPMPTAGFAGLTLTALNAGVPAPGAIELTPAGKAEFKPGCVIREQGGLAFSADGTAVYFGVAVPPPAAKPAAPGEEKVNVELWHFKDDFIQSMQKSRYARQQERTFRAVFHLGDRTCRQLADETLVEVQPGPAGNWLLGLDDRAYRKLVGSETFTSQADVYLVDSRSGTRKRVLAKPAFPPVFSPGGKYLLSFDGKDWHSLTVPGGKKVNLTAKLGVSFANELNDMPMTPMPYGVAGWMADDRHVLIHDRFDVWRIAPDGSGAKNLTAGKGRKESIQFRAVQLDREAKAFDPAKPILLRAENEKMRDTGFYRLGSDGSMKMLIMGARNYSPPVRSERGDRLLLTVTTFYDYPDLFLADLDFREVKRISNANPDKTKFLWGKAELIRFKNSDGVELQAMLVKPENFDPNKKYPMIVYIYERLSQNLHRFVNPQPGTSINPTFYASNGYLVLMPDINYTVGYPGQSAVKCVLPAVAAVVDRGYVNEKAIGLQGHSWGGYQTAYMITQTTRFKAASAGAPVVNMTSAYGGIRWGTGLPRQFQYEKTQSRIGGTLWQYPTRFLDNSPLFQADRIKTPLLMLHNDQDEAVPYQQGLEYYLALRRLGKEAYLFNYPGEAHGLRRRVNQKDYTVRLQQFFDHHLKGAAKPEWMAKGLPYTPPATRGTGR